MTVILRLMLLAILFLLPGCRDEARDSSITGPASNAVSIDPQDCNQHDRRLEADSGHANAEGWFERAEELRRSCPEQACRLYRRALPGLPPALKARALLRIGHIQLNKLQEVAPDTAQVLAEGLELAWSVSDGCLYLRGARLLAQLQLGQSELAPAERVLEEALSRLTACGDPVGRAATRFQEAELRRQQNRPLAWYEALEAAILESPSDSPDLPLYEVRMAALRHDLGDVSDEGATYQALLLRVGEQDPLLKLELNLDLVNLYRDLRRFQDAGCFVQDALELVGRHAELERKRPMIALLQAWLALEQRDAVRAARHLEAAPFSMFAGAELRHRHLWMYLHARLRLLEGAPEDARTGLERILQDEGAELELRWRSRLMLAEVARVQRRPLEARRLLWDAVNELETQREEMSGVFLELAALSQREALYVRWLEGLLEAWEAAEQPAGDDGDARSATARFVQGPVTTDDLLAAVEMMSSQAFTSRLFADRGGVRALIEAQDRNEVLPDLSRGWISGAALRSMLPEELPVLIYQPLTDRLLVLEVHRERVRVFTAPVTREQLRLRVEALEQAMQAHRDHAPPVLDALGELLLEPVRAVLQAEDRPVGFVLGQELEAVPVAALRLDGRYLVQRCFPFELPNLRAAGLLKRYGPARGDLRAVGVAFGADLAHARREVGLLSRRGFSSRLLVGAQATAKHVLEALPEQDLIHLAVHSAAPDEVRDSSGRVVQRAAGQLRLAGGSLNARELEAVSMKARLAVLSGCQSRKGRTGLLEHGYGALHRAVLLAGAEAVVASRWDVGDEVTYRLMRGLYQFYPQFGRARALALAQRALLESGASTVLTSLSSTRSTLRVVEERPVTEPIPVAAPWSWAAFSLVGRWD